MRRLLVVIGILNFLAASLLAIAKHTLPNFAWPTGLLLAATVVTCVAVPIQGFALNRGEKRRREELEQEKKIGELLTGALTAIVRSCKVDCVSSGVHAFLVRSTQPWKFRWSTERQQSICMIRLSFTTPSCIKWTKGKGIIGRCWETTDFASKDLATHFGPFMDASKDVWDGLPNETRYGLSYEEFQRTKDYGFVAAAPMFDKRQRYVGCVSFDTSRKHSQGVELHEDAIRTELQTTACFIGSSLAK